MRINAGFFSSLDLDFADYQRPVQPGWNKRNYNKCSNSDNSVVMLKVLEYRRMKSCLQHVFNFERKNWLLKK